MKPLRLAVLGATGAVGRTLLQVLDEQDFPLASVRLLASGRSAGTRLEFRGEELAVEAVREGAFRGSDLALLAAPADAAREWAPRARAEGCAVVDASPAFRMDPDVPLLVPEVNPEALAGFRGLAASPGGSAGPLAVALKPLHAAAGLERVAVVALQPASAAGEGGVAQLEREARSLMNGVEPDPPSPLPWRLAFNLVPQPGSLGPDGRAGEETGLAAELGRLLAAPGLRVAATAIRVPVFHGQLAAVGLSTRARLGAGEARSLLRGAPGVKVLDDPAAGVEPMPMLAVNDDAVHVGRVREDPTQERGLELVVAADNLRKGAATNLVQVARMVAEGLR